MLPGMFHSQGFIVPRGFTTFTVVGTSNGSGYTASLPAGFAAGDLCILYTYINSNTGSTASGMTAIAGINDNSSTTRTFAKLLNGSEGSGVTLSPSAAWICVVFRPNEHVASFTAHSPSYASNWQAQSSTLNSGSAPRTPALALTHFGAPWDVTNQGTTSPNTMTRVYGSTGSIHARYKIFAKGATLNNFTVTLNDGGSNQKTCNVTLVFN